MEHLQKKAGVYMDHTEAIILDFSTSIVVLTSVDASWSHHDKMETLSRSETTMHHKAQQKEAAYFKKIAHAIEHFNEIVLFGPTDAKVEFYNDLQAKHLFSNIKIELRRTDQLTENQQSAFVRAYYSDSRCE
jgi:stalled ribosome rescue protein Dom34